MVNMQKLSLTLELDFGSVATERNDDRRYKLITTLRKSISVSNLFLFL